jgi:ring-1,2-phenylacetyl-CoA epoxidase subunit PaaC
MTSAAAGADLLPATRNALAVLLLAIADDEFVIGFSDSEWTGIAPILEEDVAISSLAQDELGHAQAFYRLLVDLVDDGRDADAIAFDRPPEGYYHARLLDHPRGDWAQTIARRYLFDTAEDVRMAALERSSYAPLAALVTKVRREERYHLMHMATWLERLALANGEPRERLIEALERIGPDAGTVLAPLPSEMALVMSDIMAVDAAELDARWRAGIAPTFERLRLPLPLAIRDPGNARTGHSEAFRWLHNEFTTVRRIDPAATW